MGRIDILFVLDEMDTFTSQDVSTALEISNSGANDMLLRMENKKIVYRIRIGKSYVYALTAMAKRIVKKSAPINPDERALLLEFTGE